MRNQETKQKILQTLQCLQSILNYNHSALEENLKNIEVITHHLFNANPWLYTINRKRKSKIFEITKIARQRPKAKVFKCEKVKKSGDATTINESEHTNIVKTHLSAIQLFQNGNLSNSRNKVLDYDSQTFYTKNCLLTPIVGNEIRLV